MSSIDSQIEAIFGEHGKLAGVMAFEFRPQQREMAQAIACALEQQQHLIVEAPTGVGKSLAYLVPSILYALNNRKKAIISTHTKNLQEQLIRKDIEIVRKVLHREFRVALFKGRRNYLCTTRLRNARHYQRQLFENTEVDEFRKIQQWASATEVGDVESLGFIPAPSVWQQVCSERDACSSKLCGSECFFQRAKARARDADVIIMNHALFFTLFAMRNADESFLYKDDFVVFDEAHTLENVAGLGIGKNIARFQVLFAIHRLYNPKTNKGLFARLRSTQQRGLCEEAAQAANVFFDEVRSAARAMKAHSNAVRITVPYFVADTLTGPLRKLQTVVKQMEEDDSVKIQKEELASARRLVLEAEVLVKEFLEQPDPDFTYWVELPTGRFSNVTLNAAPTSVAESLSQRLFKDGTSVIMTSATLAVSGSVSYFQQRLGAMAAATLVLDSPFNLRRQMRIALVRDIPAPDAEGYEAALPRWILRCIRQSRGKALVLFTSASLMRSVADQIHDSMEAGGITLLVQDGKMPRNALLAEFKSDVHSVLFGLDSFWMGIDVPGEALEHVIITRLPFAVPDHPLIESRIELIARRGGNAFQEYSLPEAVLKFKQGIGRLIRTKTDTGLITILDSRILTKQYGRTFLESLPRCPVEIVPLEGGVEEVWES
jgi:ATP-dependent DNA helicase DinG